MKVFLFFACLIAVTAAQSKPTTTQRPSTKPPVNCNVTPGPDGWAVILPNPKACESYYVCDAGVPILMPCPDGLHFNPTLKVCDWPSAANCTSGIWGIAV